MQQNNANVAAAEAELARLADEVHPRTPTRDPTLSSSSALLSSLELSDTTVYEP
jgi:hypothetical protein